MPLRISVVIPTYKASAWIEETLQSVVRQTYPLESLELIVVDDASPDDSVDVARRFLAGHRIENRILPQTKNCGVPTTRNLGWREATGEWIQFIDQDDLLAPHKLALQAARAERAEADVAVVYSNWQHYLLQNGQWKASGAINAPFVDDDPVLRILQNPTFGYVGPTLIRRSFLEKIGGFELNPNIGEDTDLMLRLAMAGGRFCEARSDQAAFLYRQWPGSLWRSYFKNTTAMRNLLLTFHRVEEYLRALQPDGQLAEEARLALAARYSRFADVYAEVDPESFRLLMGWLAGLGFTQPLCESRALRVMSQALGFENAVRMRAFYRKLRERLR